MRSSYCVRITRGMALTALIAAGQPAWAGLRCDAPPETWQSRSAVGAMAESKGWRVERLKVDDGCYELKGRDAEGRRFKAMVDPVSLKVLSIKREHGDRARERERGSEPQRVVPPAPAPASAPVGLLTPAAAASVG